MKKNERIYTTVSTAGMSRVDWLCLRKRGIGGSEAGSVCRLNPYSSPAKIYLDKVSDEICEEEPGNEAVRLGKELEDYVAARFCQETGLKVRKSQKMYQSMKYPFMIADVDRLVVREDAGLECKVVLPQNAGQWKDDRIPPYYAMQCFHYMTVLGRKNWYLAALILGRGLVYRKLTWDDEIIRNLIKSEAYFWNEHVVKRVMPEPDGSDPCSEAIRALFPQAKKKTVISLTGFDEKLARRAELVEQMKGLDEEKLRIEQEIQMFMKDSEVAVSDGYRVTWGNAATSSLDSKRLKAEKPEIYEEFLKRGTTRKFQIKAA